jgi:hypothetical protein
MPLKLYLAGRWQQRDYINTLASELRNRGHIVTARWLDIEHKRYTKPECAQIDLDDIDAAHVLVSFTEAPDVGYNTGGRHVEFGYSIAKGKILILVGPIENIFHELPGVIRLDSFAELLDYLEELQNKNNDSDLL